MTDTNRNYGDVSKSVDNSQISSTENGVSNMINEVYFSAGSLSSWRAEVGQALNRSEQSGNTGATESTDRRDQSSDVQPVTHLEDSGRQAEWNAIWQEFTILEKSRRAPSTELMQRIDAIKEHVAPLDLLEMSRYFRSLVPMVNRQELTGSVSVPDSSHPNYRFYRFGAELRNYALPRFREQLDAYKNEPPL